MNRKITVFQFMCISTAVLLFFASLSGILSWNTSMAYNALNQYGETIKMWGSGIYAHDSFFKAPILIGTDASMLSVTLPVLIVFIVRDIIKHNSVSRLLLVSVEAWVLYYAASLCFGVSYNRIFLVYAALFSCSLFTFITGAYSWIQDKHETTEVSGILSSARYTVFLVLSALSAFVAWLPDIFDSIASGKLKLISVYTTEPTYVLDMGIISPAAIVCIILLRKHSKVGKMILSVMNTGIILIGILMLFQMLFQLLSGAEMPLIAVISKSVIFVLLAVYAAVLSKRIYTD